MDFLQDAKRSPDSISFSPVYFSNRNNVISRKVIRSIFVLCKRRFCYLAMQQNPDLLLAYLGSTSQEPKGLSWSRIDRSSFLVNWKGSRNISQFNKFSSIKTLKRNIFLFFGPATQNPLILGSSVYCYYH